MNNNSLRRIAKVGSLAVVCGYGGMVLADTLPSPTGYAIPIDPRLWETSHFTQAGGDLDELDARGETRLVVAALTGDMPLAAYLVGKGADVMGRTKTGLTPLHAAAFSGSKEVAAYLIRSGADPDDQKNKYGITPLHAAAEQNHPEVIQVLLDAGASATLVQASGYTAASMAGFRAYWDAMSLLMKAGAGCQPKEIAGPWLFEKCQSFLTPG